MKMRFILFALFIFMVSCKVDKEKNEVASTLNDITKTANVGGNKA